MVARTAMVPDGDPAPVGFALTPEAHAILNHGGIPGISSPIITGTCVNATGGAFPEGALIAPGGADAAFGGDLDAQLATAADISVIAANVLGVVTESGGVASGGGIGTMAFAGPVRVLLVIGLTLITGQDIYLSAATPGRGTNVAPSGVGVSVQRVGTLVGKLTYTGAGEALAYVLMFPAQRTEVK